MQEVEQRREQLSRMGVDCLLDAGRYGLPRYLFQTLLYLLHPCSRVLLQHFLHPVGRFHQHDDEDTYSEVPWFWLSNLLLI